MELDWPESEYDLKIEMWRCFMILCIHMYSRMGLSNSWDALSRIKSEGKLLKPFGTPNWHGGATVGLDYLFVYVDSSSFFAGRTLWTAKQLRHTVWSLKILEAFPSLTVRRSVGLFVEIMLSELVRWVPSKDPIHIISYVELLCNYNLISSRRPGRSFIQNAKVVPVSPADSSFNNS